MEVLIIGSGSAAFACALKVTAGGAQVTMVEAANLIGGCCVNVGCVPSKIMIRAAQMAQHQRRNPFNGVGNHMPEIDRVALLLQQQARVDELREAKYQNILDSNPDIRLVNGFASFLDPETVRVKQDDGSETILTPDKVLIATGSTPILPDIDGLADSPYWSSTEALFTSASPATIIVIGSSVIAVEIAQAYQRLGTQVTLLARSRLLSKLDPLLGQHLKRCLEAEGMAIFEDVQFSKVGYSQNQFTVCSNKGTFQAERLLVSTGRQPATALLQLDNGNIKTDKHGAVKLNKSMQTSNPNVYAAGDCTVLPQYVYVAAAAGSRAGMNMIGGSTELDLSVLPAVIFTDPQVATVGLSEDDAKRECAVQSRTLTMDSVPRALANFQTDGFIKLVAELDTGRILGAQILAHEAGEIIQSAALAIRNQMTVEDLAAQLFPYLTMVEGLKLCAQTFNTDVSQLSCCAG